MARRANARYDVIAKDGASGTIRKVSGGFKDMDSLVYKLTGGMSLLGAMNVGVFAAIYKAQAPVIDQLAKTSDKLGIATEKLQAMRDAGERAGVSQGSLDISLQRMVRRVAEASTGTGEAVKALDALGLSAKELVQLSPDQQFAKISDELAKVDNQSQKVALAFKFFDSGGVNMVNLTSDAINEAAEEMESLGISITRLDAAKVEAANDSFQRMGRNITGVQQKMTVGMSGALTALSGQFNTMAADAGGWGVVATNAAYGVLTAVGVLGDFTERLGLAWDTVSIKIDKVVVAKNKLLNFLDLSKNKREKLIASIALAEERSALETQEIDLADRKAKLENLSFSQGLMLRYEQALIESSKRAKSIIANYDRPIAPTSTAAPQAPAATIPGVDATGPLDTYNSYIDGVEAQFARLGEIYKTDEQRVYDSFEAKRATVEEYAALGVEQRLAANDLLFEIEDEKERKLTAIEEAGLTERDRLARLSATNRSKHLFGEMKALTAGVAQQNRAMFEINKAAAIAEGILGLRASVLSAYEFGSAFGPVVAAGYAAIAGAAQLANLEAIRGSSYSGGGGGSAPSQAASPGIPVTPTTAPTAAPQQQVQQVIQLFGHDYLDQDAVDNALTLGLERISQDDKLQFNNKSGFTANVRAYG
ncbi:MAG: hypothetical protein GY712_04275 [Oceanicoccus sp.]|uniref:hypothetical protein n=1 Tax=Oceanicoccus sp. TaxID=2691044 RepID=UPI002631506B|nr:hypothetical protein [Oceanicoccus sp.]MCP3907212.1 hypothetical protein [Oceanicoccus sp.]